MEAWLVMPCPDGPSAFSTVDATRPDLVLLNVRLDAPRRGWEILHQLRQTDWGRHLPVVVCSAAAVLADWPAEVGRLYSAVLSKPFELSDLISTVSRSIRPSTQQSVS